MIKENEKAMEIFCDTVEKLEKLQKLLAEIYGLDNEGTKFSMKKIVTSAMRRIAPMGTSTSLMWSANIRALRWIIELRTDPSAEEEIRFVFSKIAKIVINRYPNLFNDSYVKFKNGLPHYFLATQKCRVKKTYEAFYFL